jgi:hypothetical protein
MGNILIKLQTWIQKTIKKFESTQEMTEKLGTKIVTKKIWGTKSC